jgi:hypothetical protein
MLALVEERDGTGEFLVFQAFDAYDDQDRRLGEAGTCVVRPDGETAYHAVRHYVVDAAVLHLSFTGEGAAQLGLASELTLGLEISPGQRAVMLHWMSVMLGPERTDLDHN